MSIGANIVWEGVSQIDRAIDEYIAKAHDASRDFVVRGLHLAEASMKEHAGEGGRHRKGEPTGAVVGFGPAVVTGTLRRSIRVGNLTPVGMTGYQGEVGPTAIYGRRVELEYGYPYAQPGWADTVPLLPSLHRSVYAEHMGL